MKAHNVTKKILLSAALVTAAAAVHAQAVDTKGTVGYVIDQRGVLARSGTGLCWRTGYWTPALAIIECDPDLVPKPAPAPAPVVTPPPPPPKPAPVAKVITISAKNLFDFDKADLKPGAKQVLDREIVAKLPEFGKVQTMIISGHTDRIGSSNYNQKLSEKRANAVKTYLVSRGVDAGVVATYGYGKTQPLPEVKCDDKLPRKKLIECLEPNRRVTVEVKGMSN